MNKNRNLFFKSIFLGGGIVLATSFMNVTPQEKVLQNGNRTEEAASLRNKETVADFRGVAKKTIPAVVSIKVQSKRKASSIFGNGQNGQSDDSFEFFDGNDIWKFFGIPKRDVPQTVSGQASGVIVDPNGHILTNSHVVHNMDNITVQLNDGREFPAKVLGDDSNSELALLKIEADNLPYLTLGNSDDLEVGQWVAAIGNPFGLQATLTVGVVSAKSRNNLDIARYEDFIQTDAAINRGNSGGPLVTLDGEIIGINTAIATTTSSGYLGIGFAIPSNMAKLFMSEILSNGKFTRGFLGVALQPIDHNLAKAFGLKKVEGALVTSVSKDSAAERGGLQVEDIILRYNDRPVENAASLRNAVYMMKPGTKVVLTVLRKDQMIELPIVVGDFKDNTVASTKAATKKNSLGIEVDNLTSDLAERLGYTLDHGVIITRVDPSGVASLSGLKKGALILAVNRKKVTNVTEFNQALSETPEGNPVLLQVKQGEVYMYVSLQSNNPSE